MNCLKVPLCVGISFESVSESDADRPSCLAWQLPPPAHGGDAERGVDIGELASARLFNVSAITELMFHGEGADGGQSWHEHTAVGSL